MNAFRTLCAVFLALVLTACGANANTRAQQEQDQHDFYARQQKSTEEYQLAFATMGTAAMNACTKDTNPGLCVSMALREFREGKPAPVAPPRPTPSPWPMIASEVLRGVLGLGGQYFAYKTNSDNIDAWSGVVSTVATNSGTHVGGNFINGNQDNHVDNSVSVGGNLGDTYGAGFTGGDRTETTTTNSGTLVSGADNVLGDRNNNSGSQDSPTYDNSGNCIAGAGAPGGDGSAESGQGGAGAAGGPCSNGNGG